MKLLLQRASPRSFGSRQRIDVVVVEIDPEMVEWIDKIDHDVAAHGAELTGLFVVVAHHASAGRMENLASEGGAALVESDDARLLLEAERPSRGAWRQAVESGMLDLFLRGRLAVQRRMLGGDQVADILGDHFSVFQLPTIFAPMMAPNPISVRRDMPRHMTMFPGGGSCARAR